MNRLQAFFVISILKSLGLVQVLRSVTCAKNSHCTTLEAELNLENVHHPSVYPMRQDKLVKM
jgi:hypothetical protein